MRFINLETGSRYKNEDDDVVLIVANLANGDYVGVLEKPDEPQDVAYVYSPGGIGRGLYAARLMHKIARGEAAWSSLTPELRAGIRALAHELPSKKITVIKIVRQLTNMGLGEAKDIVEDIVGGHHGGFTNG